MISAKRWTLSPPHHTTIQCYIACILLSRVQQTHGFFTAIFIHHHDNHIISINNNVWLVLHIFKFIKFNHNSSLTSQTALITLEIPSANINTAPSMLEMCSWIGGSRTRKMSHLWKWRLIKEREQSRGRAQHSLQSWRPYSHYYSPLGA